MKKSYSQRAEAKLSSPNATPNSNFLSLYFNASNVLSKIDSAGTVKTLEVSVSTSTGLSLSGSNVSITSKTVPLTSLSLGSGVDLDTLDTPGFYHQPSNASASNGSNYPVAKAGSLEVKSAAGIVQMYHTYGSENNVYIRTKYSTTWYAWRKLLTTSDITSTNISNWNTAYGWGNHSSAGYLSTASAGLVKAGSDVKLGSPSSITATSTNLASGTTHTHLLETYAVTSAKIASGAVLLSKLASNSVSTVKIQNAAVTVAKISASATIGYVLKTTAAGTVSWAADNNTTYSNGTGLDLQGTSFSLKHLAIESLTDPGVDRIMFWDHSSGSGAMKWLNAGSNLSISGTDLNAVNTNTTNFNIRSNTSTSTNISAGETISFINGTGITASRTNNDIRYSLSHLGIQSLTDPNVDRIMFWDDSVGAMKWLNAGSNLSISGTNLNATNTNTTYTAGTGLTLSGTVFSHGTNAAKTQTTTGVDVIEAVTSNGYGHITTISKRTLPTGSLSQKGVIQLGSGSMHAAPGDHTHSYGSMSSWTIKEGTSGGGSTTSVTNGETLTIQEGSGITARLTSTSSGGTITISNIQTTNLTSTLSSTTVTINSSTGSNVALSSAVAGGNAGILTGADKSKIDSSDTAITNATSVNIGNRIVKRDGNGDFASRYITASRIYSSQINSTSAISILNGSGAQKIYTGGILASNAYSDSSYIPSYGIYSKGNIKTSDKFEIKATTGNDIDTFIDFQENTDVDPASEVVATMEASAFTGAWFDYVVEKGTNFRAGTVMAVHDGTICRYTDNSTDDIDDTSDVKFEVIIDGGDIKLIAKVTSNDWNIRCMVRGIK